MRRQLTVLLLSTLLVGLVCLTVTALLLRTARAAHAELESVLVPAQQYVSSIDRTISGTADRWRGGGAGDPLDETAVEQARTTLDDLIGATTSAVAPSSQLSRDIATIDSATANWLDAVAATVATPETADVLATIRLHDELQALVDRFADDVLVAIDDARSHASTSSDWILVMLAITGSALVGGTGLSLVVFRRSVLRPLDQLVHEIRTVADGDLGSPIHPSGPSDLASVGTAAERMRRRLLDDAERRTESAVIAGHLAESSRIAGQLHDDQVQAMTLVSIRLQQVARRAAGDPELEEVVGLARAATSDAIERLRRMMFELHSPVIETEGLAAAIEVYIDETFDEDVTGTVHSEITDLPPATAALAYRLVREALMNVLKHASASSFVVDLRTSAGMLVTTVTDDGVGFDVDAVAVTPGHLGVAHAEELATAAGGTWAIRSAPGAGTTVTIRLPIR